jgi:STE24 endopeptidase
LLNQGTSAEVRAVMGHELGHYVLNHIWSMIIYFSLIILGGYLAVSHFVPALLARHGDKWRVHSLGDPAAIPVAVLVLAAYFLVMTPLVNTVIRTQEQEADVFGLNAARAPDGFAKIAMKLSTYRKIEPGKWEEIIFFDHPSGRTRVTTAMQWKAEHLGEPGVE